MFTRYTPHKMMTNPIMWCTVIISLSLIPQIIATIGIKYVHDVANNGPVILINLLKAMTAIAELIIANIAMLPKLVKALGWLCIISKKLPQNR